jgi:phosphoglycolate phosphatase
MSKVILFDFDGTLAATADVGVAAFNEVARRDGFLEITPENRDELRKHGPSDVAKALKVPILRTPSVLMALRQGIKDALPSLAVPAGVQDAVSKLHGAGYKLGIVTANSKENVMFFLKNHSMADYFDYFQTGMGLFGKAGAIGKLMEREGFNRNDVIFVGDEIRDVEAAQKNGVAVIGVTWGVNSREGLESAKPNFIVDTAQQLLERCEGSLPA